MKPQKIDLSIRNVCEGTTIGYEIPLLIRFTAKDFTKDGITALSISSFRVDVTDIYLIMVYI